MEWERERSKGERAGAQGASKARTPSFFPSSLLPSSLPSFLLPAQRGFDSDDADFRQSLVTGRSALPCSRSVCGVGGERPCAVVSGLNRASERVNITMSAKEAAAAADDAACNAAGESASSG